MKFRTEIKINPAGFQINHKDKIQIIGSCFAENIAKKLNDTGFITDVNPFGIIYNPSTIAKSITEIIEEKQYTNDEIFLYEGIYHSASHHSRFSDTNRDATLNKINSKLNESSDFIRQATVILITFGTAYVYRFQKTGEIVANCHKMPEKMFIRTRLNVKEIVENWTVVIKKLQEINENLKIIFSISPVRHFRDGFHENQLSKSIMLLAVNEIINNFPNCNYFPSYEILMDDLRDYRFYDDSLVHPSTKAIEYIWEKFAETFFNKETINKAEEFINKQKALKHIPLN
ncbi:MAG: GSCFA domain-containing protein [Dysgonamonadaceae bacterium]|nr:GSCFA domain-containing protein [Dysgonamonadaceae bacterium]